VRWSGRRGFSPRRESCGKHEYERQMSKTLGERAGRMLREREKVMWETFESQERDQEEFEMSQPVDRTRTRRARR
jgi:myo-inositol-1-phosphate synthase